MEIANKWADGEESVWNERARSPQKDDGNRNERRKRQRTREAGDSEFVAAEFSKNRDGGYRGSREWRPKPEEKPISQQLDNFCSMHAYRDKESGQLKANHTLRNCRKLQMITQALTHNQRSEERRVGKECRL